MRARWVKPEFFQDRKIAQLGPIPALVYQALWVISDDYGTAPCDPDRINGALFYCWSAVGVPEITGALRALNDAGRITRYKVGDDTYCKIKKWDKHQKVHKPSNFRNPIEGQPLTENSAEDYRTTPELSVTPHHLDTKTPRHLDTQESVALVKIGGALEKKIRQSELAQHRRQDLETGARMVFAYFLAAFGKTEGYKLDKKRLDRIVARLRENSCDVSELFYVADGAKLDHWIMGTDPRSTKAYKDVSTIFRDREQVERLRDNVTDREDIHPTFREMLGEMEDVA